MHKRSSPLQNYKCTINHYIDLMRLHRQLSLSSRALRHSFQSLRCWMGCGDYHLGRHARLLNGTFFRPMSRSSWQVLLVWLTPLHHLASSACFPMLLHIRKWVQAIICMLILLFSRTQTSQHFFVPRLSVKKAKNENRWQQAPLSLPRLIAMTVQLSKFSVISCLFAGKA